MLIANTLPRLLWGARDLAFALAGCGVNSIPSKDEAVKAALGNVQAEYQRRSDLSRPISSPQSRPMRRRRNPCLPP